jgi:[acyl-carrier-protein] S-malonyltransferase
MRIAFVFPGQGAQSVGMLGGFAGNKTVEEVMARADAALGFSLSGLIASGPAEALALSVNTQPAMLASSVAFYEAWRAAGGAVPAVMAGHSLGEWSALTAAGAFSLEEAVKLVRFRAEAMQAAVPVGVGGMTAIIGLSDEAVEEVCREVSAAGVVEPVNYNSPGQVVIAGRKGGAREGRRDRQGARLPPRDPRSRFRAPSTRA